MDPIRPKINVAATSLKVALTQSTEEHDTVFQLLQQDKLRRPYGTYKRKNNNKSTTAPLHDDKKLTSQPRSATQEQGYYYEEKAISYLKENGLRFVARNLRCKGGELDCVMLDQDCLVFVEVRQRTHNTYGDAAASIGKEKQRRIKRCAHYFLPRLLRHLGYTTLINYRFDVISYDGNSQSPQWFKNAFS